MLLRASDGIRGRVIDLDTGKIVRKVISLNTDTGYLEAYKVDSRGEILKDSEGNYLIYSAVGRFKYESQDANNTSRNNSTSNGNCYSSPNGGNPHHTIFLSEKLVMGAPKCARCSSNLTLPGDDLCPTCRAKQGTQKHPMKVERIINPLLDRKCENCSRLAAWSVSDEVVVTPEAGVFRRYKALYDRGMTVGRRYYCSWHYIPPRLLDAKGEIIKEFEEDKVRPR